MAFPDDGDQVEDREVQEAFLHAAFAIVPWNERPLVNLAFYGNETWSFSSSCHSDPYFCGCLCVFSPQDCDDDDALCGFLTCLFSLNWLPDGW